MQKMLLEIMSYKRKKNKKKKKKKKEKKLKKNQKNLIKGKLIFNFIKKIIYK